MAYNVIDILNTIRDNGSLDYNTRIPVATKDNLTNVGQAITSYSATANEFLNALINQIAMVMITSKIIENPLAPLKKGGIPLGQDIEDLFVNPSTGEKYAMNSTDLLTVKKPDVKSTFYRLNRQDKYTVTISQPMLSRAFTSEGELSALIDGIVNSLYSGDNFDEFILMKNLLTRAVKNNHINKVNIFDANIDEYNETTSKDLVRNIKTYSKMFTFPSSNYNRYSQVKGGTETPVITWTPREDQILILNSIVSTNIDLDVLAYAFNLDKAQITAQTIDVDNFGDEPVLAILTDRSFFQVYDNLLRVENFYNGDTLAFKYFLHHWQTYAYSLYANAIAFTYTPEV